jgi:CBS domain-containing protein
MHAAEVAQSLPVAHLDDTAMSAVQVVVAQGVPGLVVTDEADQVVACVSAVDLLRLVLPDYLRGRPCLSRVIEEDVADRIAARLTDVPLRQVVTETEGGVPEARAEATLVELAELMGRRGCALALVRADTGGAHGVVTVHRLLEALAAGAAGEQVP